MTARFRRCIYIVQARREQVRQSSRQAAVALILDCYSIMNQSGIGRVLLCPLIQNQIRQTAGKLAAIDGMIGRAGHALLVIHGADHDPVDQAAGGKLSHIQLQLEGEAAADAQVEQSPVGLGIGVAFRPDG